MKSPALLLSATSMLIARTASAQAEFFDPAATPISAWYAVLIAVFAVLVGLGLVSSQRDQQDHNKRPESQPRSDARTLRRSKNDDQ